MLIQRYYLSCLSHASYLVADEQLGEAAVIDPQRDVDQYITDAAEHGWKIRHVILTHFHADFVAGHIELRDRCGAKIYLGRRAEAQFDFQPLADGDTIEFGNVKLAALETPGHTPEGLTILAYDTANNANEPYAAFTGDTLFLGDVGRPDLLASIGVTADELARMLYHSLYDKILKLPDATLVYPAHGAGSMCGKQLSDEAVTPLGDQKKYNYALQPMSEDEFVAMITADQPEAPAYFVHDAILNRQERSSLDETLRQSLRPLTLDAVLQLADAGAQLVDTRAAADFAAAHLRGSLNIGIDGKYATWAGTVLSKEKPIVVIAETDRVEESIMRLGRIGFDHVQGFLEHGMEALARREDLIATTPRITAQELADELADVTLLDVRSEKEYAGGHVPGSVNIPLNHLGDRLDEVPQMGRLVVHCQGGYRSSLAVSLLERQGRHDAVDMVGGFQAWVKSGLPVVEETKQRV
ncbi:MAG: MBL fold metallo-hydrolase [Pirellulales bacterium]